MMHKNMQTATMTNITVPITLNDENELSKEIAKIIQEEIRPGQKELLDTIHLSEPFCNFKKEDVAVSHAYLVSN